MVVAVVESDDIDLVLLLGLLVIREPLWRVLGVGHGLRAAAHLPRQPRPGHLDLLAGDQPNLVAGHDRGRAGDPARLLGLPAGVPRAGAAPADLGRVLRAVPGLLRHPSGVRGARPPAQVARSQSWQYGAERSGARPGDWAQHRGAPSCWRQAGQARLAATVLCTWGRLTASRSTHRGPGCAKHAPRCSRRAGPGRLV